MLLLAFANFYVFLFLFFIQVIPFIFWFLAIIYVFNIILLKEGYFFDLNFVTDYDYPICLYFVGTYFFWLFLVWIHRDISRTINSICSSVVLFIYYCILGLTMIGVTIYKAITTQTITLEWLFKVCNYLLPCYFILVALFTFYIFFRFYFVYST